MITEIKCDILNFLSSLLSLNLFIIGISIKFEIANKMFQVCVEPNLHSAQPRGARGNFLET